MRDILVNILVKYIAKVLVSILVAMVGYLMVGVYNRICSMEAELVKLRLEVAKLRIPSEEEIRNLARLEIHQYMMDQRKR